MSPGAQFKKMSELMMTDNFFTQHLKLNDSPPQADTLTIIDNDLKNDNQPKKPII